MLRKTLALAGLAIGGLWAPAGFAQDIVIPNIIELSGGGATVGAMWKNGSSMAVEEINASGGILGKKIKLEFIDTASDPGKARAAMQRALDDKPIADLRADLFRFGERHAQDDGRRRGAAGDGR